MDKTTTNIEKKTFSINKESFAPTAAIGKLLFFDYTKNKFGFIAEIKCNEVFQTDKVHVSLSGLATDKKLNDGEFVTLLLNKGQKGYYATNVKPLYDINLKTIINFVDLIGISELEKAIYNSVQNYYQNLDAEDMAIIVKVLQKKNKLDAWKLLIRIGAYENIIEKFITEFIAPLKDADKLTFLKKSYNSSLLYNILINWTTEDSTLISDLIETIKYKEFKEVIIPNSFIKIVSNQNWTFDKGWKIYSVLKYPDIASKVLNEFSFKENNCIERLKSLIPIDSKNVVTIERLQTVLHSERDNITAEQLIYIYTELKDYKIIQNENELLELLIYRQLNDSEITYLISHLSDSCQITSFREIISNNIKNVSSWQFIDLIKLCKQKNELTKILIDEYFSQNRDDSYDVYSKIIDILKDNNRPLLTLYFIEKYYKQLAVEFPIEILELAIITKHIEAQKFTYQNINFKTENEVVIVVEKIIKYDLFEEVKNSNKPLTAFVNFLNSTLNFELSEDCKQFLQINKGIVQCLSVKFLIFQLYKKNISKTQLVEILESFKWTEISALLIKAFIQESNYTENILLENLNEIFKTHFDVLLSQNFDKKSFLDNFTIQNILNDCSGRKYYDAELWQKNGVSRWYVKGTVTTYIKDNMLCFCEGRPWKKESMWDSYTNKPSSEQYEFYWCKNSYCAERNDTINLNKPYNHWTIPEISEALNIKIEKNAIATLAGWANRMNQIVEHLFCRSCNAVLRPLAYRPKTLGYYSVPVFHCVNENCTDNQTIRFTHCLNGKCESHKTSEPLDSRDCKSCRPSDINHTGLQCNYCGSSCPACSGQNNRITVNESW